MNITEKFPTVSYRDKQYPYRYVTIFQNTDEECYIKVSTQSLGDAIIANNDESCDIDNLFACFVDDNLFVKLNDAKLSKHIEEDYYF